jgi:hypothetical protein
MVVNGKATMRPNVDFSRLRALLFCREVQNKSSGVTLVDIHDTRLATTFPATFPELCLYLSFEVSRQQPVELELRVHLPDGSVHTVATSTMTPDESRLILSPIDLHTYEFLVPGQHSFAIYADGTLIGASTLTIEAVASVNPVRNVN